MMIYQTQELSKHEIATVVETAEQTMWTVSWNSTPPEMQQALSMHFASVGGASATVIEKFPIPFFNRVIGLGIHQPATEALVDELISIYQQYDVPWEISLSPLALPSDTAEWLTARGFKHTSNLAKMIRGNEPPPIIATDLRIERVGAHNASVFAEINQRAFEMPDWYPVMVQHLLKQDNVYGYIAYDGDSPAGSGLLMVSGDVGGLFSGATLPEYRRRGAQRAIMTQRVRDGLDLGCRWFSTETGEESPQNPNPSYHNMLRTGFELAYLRPNYTYQPAN
ncbi:MAG: GNAT family N-acetyltransferase [Anaerolineaceae bacterium]|nr:GNAT family N-acetyltransferase [Anaerolineaceae bacterium]